jgi:SSS family transporter
VNFPKAISLPQLIAIALLTAASWAFGADEPAIRDVTCSALSLPAPPEKLVGSFIGTSANALVAAGGQSPSGRPSDSAYVLVNDSEGKQIWQYFQLHEKLAWGASVTTDNALICIGGVGERGCEKSVIRLRWQNGKLLENHLTDLPAPRAWGGAGVLGNVIYIVGGIADPNSLAASNDLFSLDLSNPNPQWKTEPPLPGPGRAESAVIAQYYGIEVFGGRIPDGAGGFTTTAESFVFRPKPLDFTIRRRWIKEADLPLPLAGGAAIPTGQAHTLLVGADMQQHIGSLPSAWKTAQTYQPILAYHAVTDAWCTLGSYEGAATPAAVTWGNRTILFTPDWLQQLAVNPVVRHLHVIDYIIVAGYVLLITFIGLTFSRKQKTTEEFSLGGRGAPWWVAALSLYATATSSISLMAVPALTFATNLVWLFQPIISVFVLIPQAWLVIPLIRRMNLTSTYEYLEKRFNPALRLLASFQCIVFYTVGRSSVVILIPAIAISAVTGMNVYVAILAVGLLTTIYTSLGGIDAVMWTDVIQAIVMLLGPLITIGVVIYSLGGLSTIHQVGAQYGKFDIAIWSWTWTEPVAWIMVFNIAVTLTGFAGEQAMVQRVLSTPNDKAARKATIGNWAVCIGGAAIVQIMGILLFVYFHVHPVRLDPTMNNDRVVPLFIVQTMPAGVAGLLLAGIFAASMSCLSGTVNSAATLMVHDFYRRWRPNSSDRHRLILLKVLSYFVGLTATGVAAWLAKMPMRSLMETLTTMQSLCGAGFAGVYTLGIFSRRANGAGALTGAVASAVVTILAKQFTPMHWTLYIPLAISSCIVVGYLASLLTPAPRRDLAGLTAFTLKNRGAPADAPGELASVV